MPSNPAPKISAKSKRPNDSSRNEGRHKKKQKVTQESSGSETQSDTQEDQGEDEDEEDEDDQDGSKSSDVNKPNAPVSFKAKKGQRITSKFQPFLSAAQLMPSLCHPYPNFLEIFEAGLVRDSLMEKNSLCEISDDPADLRKLLKCYDFLKTRVGESKFNKLIFEALSTDRLSDLMRDMNHQVSDAMSQDIRYLKHIILEYAEDALGTELFPRIKRNSLKSETRGYYHPQLARLLVPTSKLEVFLNNEDEFCNKYQDNDLANGPITSTELPSFFYADLGIGAACDDNKGFDGLLYGWLIIQTLVQIFLGDVNAERFREHYKSFRKDGTSSRFKVKKVGLAHTHHIYSVTMEMIAYTTIMICHALSSCNDRRGEEGNVVKIDAYDAVMAIIDDPEIYDEVFITELMKFYSHHIGWMLPVPKKGRNLRDTKNPNCGLTKLAVLKKKRAEAKKAEEEAKKKDSSLSQNETEPANADIDNNNDSDDDDNIIIDYDETIKPDSSSTWSDNAPSSSSRTIVDPIVEGSEPEGVADKIPSRGQTPVNDAAMDIEEPVQQSLVDPNPPVNPFLPKPAVVNALLKTMIPSASKPQPESKSKKSKKGNSSTLSGQKFQPLVKSFQSNTESNARKGKTKAPSK